MLTQDYGTSTIVNAYDSMGRLLTATEGGTALSYVYDNLGRNTSFTDQAGRTSTYTYDLLGHRLNSTYPTSVVVKKAYDSSNRLLTLKDGGDNTLVTYSYDILDRVTGATLANSTSVSYGYDLLNRLGSVGNTLGGTTTRNYSYVYDNASRVTSITEPRGTIASGYTNRNEVNSITEPTGSPFSDQSFAYDAGFNRSNWTYGTASTNYTANNLNQYTAVGAAAPTWNTDGGLHAFSGNTYIYDHLQRLIEVDTSLGKYIFSYDPLGRRVKKVAENTSGTVLATYAYHYDGSDVAVEYQPSTTWTYYGGLMRTDGTSKQWYYRDGQGSVSAVADNSGNLLEAYEYNAQGQFQIANASGTALVGTAIANDIMYTGQRYDAETGNYFYHARYYNPTLGRFISRDPLSGAEFSQGTNLYAYCDNDYLNADDPTGMCDKNLDQSKTKPGPTTKAKSPPLTDADKAAIKALEKINPKSQKEGKEYAGRIYSSTYTTTPTPGTEDGSNPGDIPPGTTDGGEFHTHPYVDDGTGHNKYDSEHFSPADEHWSDTSGTPGYIDTPSNSIYKYTPGSTPYGGTVTKLN